MTFLEGSAVGPVLIHIPVSQVVHGAVAQSAGPGISRSGPLHCWSWPELGHQTGGPCSRICFDIYINQRSFRSRLKETLPPCRAEVHNQSSGFSWGCENPISISRVSWSRIRYAVCYFLRLKSRLRKNSPFSHSFFSLLVYLFFFLVFVFCFVCLFLFNVSWGQSCSLISPMSTLLAKAATLPSCTTGKDKWWGRDAKLATRAEEKSCWKRG